jgi:metal-sulfur cluster biosynthetic enzyme
VTGTHRPSLPEKYRQVVDAVNQIIDPCSKTIGVPAGLGDMGLIDQILLDGSTVRISLLPTTPGCILLGALEEEMKKSVGALAWCDHVEIELARSVILWDETRLAPHVRSRLEQRRRRLRERGELLRAQAHRGPSGTAATAAEAREVADDD